MFGLLDLVADGHLNIAVKVTIVGGQSGFRVLPSIRGSSKVAAFGVSGLNVVRMGQKIPNLMKVGDIVRTVISEKRLRFKKFKEASSLDLYHAYQQGEQLTFGFAFSVNEGDYSQKALFSVLASKINEYGTNARPVTGVIAPGGLEVIDFDFDPQTAHVDYVKELDSMFEVRVKEQQRRIVKLVSGR